MRTRILGSILLALLPSLVPGVARAADLSESSPGELLVVSMNLQEAFSADDVADHADVDNFVERLLLQVPHAPDVVMLQEVVRASAS